MNVVSKTVVAFLDFVVINVIALPFATIDPMLYAWYSLCILLAFVLRLGMEARKNRLTWRTLMYQSIYTISWSFFMILVWTAWLKYKSGFEVYLFINSLFAVFMVSQFEIMFEIGFKEWLRIKLGKFLATDKPTGTTPTLPENPEDNI